MRILEITAGAARMYCGSCIRDNALAAELKRQGHDVILLPLYTPTHTDEENVSDARVFMGGIGVYLQQHSALFRHTPRLLDKLWDSTWALDLASRRSIAVSPRALGEMTVSMLRGEQGHQRKEVRKFAEWLAAEAPPDIVTLPNSLLIGLAGPISRAVPSPVCCTLQGEDLFLSLLEEPYRTTALDLIRANLRHVDGFVAVSEYYAGFMCRFLGIPERKMHVVPLGINMDGHAPAGRTSQAPPRIGFFARIAPEKGLHNLVDAYIALRASGRLASATLEAAGYLAPEHAPYLRKQHDRMSAAGLAAEFVYHGVPDRAGKIAFLQSLDVMSVPSGYDEPKGLFLLEALANGVPVVQPHRGAYPEILAKTGGGVLVPPDDVEALAGAIVALINDAGKRAGLAREGASGVRRHYAAPQMAARAIEVYGSIRRERHNA